ncbi:nucleotidyltransferase family protein [Rubrivirga sp. S365]|uniref:Nucleotidyltransferase family protein n=1 Tax=Rubrivirga litoralis TaxID=3075598 RepID=A0ABU3BTM9_9BACT|nr:MULTISPECIES: nucleotidyltransferase family protein [unclassified Rubrivirga]MDT0632644.1 nucleotidyltransferase family protein [Rubrivirga sp. F394]MDT7857179.1 nucleotidyltransferase family protein [Rubrivirga sp. S365]
MSARRLGAVVLAAGRSSRMGRENKLLADLAGRPVLDHVLDLATDAMFADAVVVGGYDRSAVSAVAQARSVRTVHNARWRDGMGASMRVAVADLDPDLDGVVVLLGDVPLVQTATLVRLAEVWRQSPAPAIVRPIWRGQPGHPVVFSKAFVPDLLRLRGDDGARAVLIEHTASLVRVDTGDEGVTMDADTPHALATLRRRVRAL